jgi:formate dehydrogenase (NADP+) beta subunit
MSYHVELPDIEYYQRAIKCQAACPVRTDARAYVMAIAAGDDERAYRIAREPNPLASICGRICAAPCEVACRRGSVDAPVAIRPLKRFVTEQYGVESAQPVALDGPAGFSTTRHDRSALRELAAQPDRRHGRVAVIGAGPAGLATAHELALLGHQVTLFEAADEPGGMVRQGVPLYRLSRELLDREIRSIRDLGVELCTNVTIGEEISLADLRRDYDAVFLGAGLRHGRDLRIEGADLDGVFKAVDYLLNVHRGYRVDLGRRVVVIGGGNVAVDAARTALRAQLGQVDVAQLSTEKLHVMVEETHQAISERDSTKAAGDETLHSALDAARTAIRLGAAEVHMVALEDWHELPAAQFEIEEALEEGIRIHVRLGPHRILGQDGKVTGLETVRVQSVFDDSGRFNPTFMPDSLAILACDSLILAIGQAADLTFLEGAADIEINARGLISVDSETMATTAPGVWAGGDVVFGPRIIIEAVRDGQKAARAIEAHIQGRSLQVVKYGQMRPYARARRGIESPGYLHLAREKPPTTPLERRIGIDEVEVGYDAEQARRQAERCLECGVNTVFDSAKCILCAGCVDVCPWDCLKLVRLNRLTGDEHVAALVETIGPEGGAIIKDETLCTRCALCAERCPTGAITMEQFSFEEKLVYV